MVDQGRIVQLGKASELLAQHANVPLKSMPNRILMLGLITATQACYGAPLKASLC